MTIIVGLKHKKHVYMGCDSAATEGWGIDATNLHKVFMRGDFLIGYTESFRMGQLLQYKLDVKPQAKKQSDLEYIATTFIDSVRKCLLDGGFSKIESNSEEGGQFLVGYNGCLYVVYPDFHVNSFRNGVMAIGCGLGYALGSMRETKTRKPRERIRRALKTAGHYSAGVCGPYRIKKI